MRFFSKRERRVFWMNSPERLIAENGFYAATVHGDSMEPLLTNHRDTVYIEPAAEYRKRDVVLFRRADGQLVLHRLIGCDKNGLWACGDNDFHPEAVLPSQILGVMTEFTRNGRTVSVRSFGYRLYSRVWSFSLPTKRLLHGIRRLGRRRE